MVGGPKGDTSTDMYLKSIEGLSQARRPVPISALAGHLGITVVSATEMVHRLQARGLLTHARYRGVRLTTEGRKRARQVIRRHRVWEQFLASELGLPWEQVHDMACQLEHAAGADITEALARRLGDPVACPHGNPIPTARRAARGPRPVPLVQLAAGNSAVIQRVWPESAALLEHLAERGLKPGTRIVLERIDAFGGPRWLRAGRRRVALGPDAAARLLVSPE